MGKKERPQPTEAELNILNALWECGPSTVRQVQRHLNRQRPTGYTTVLKFLQIMMGKGLVERDESERPQVYKARGSRSQTQKQLLADLLDRAFEGSTARLVMQALSTKKATPEELDEIHKLLDELSGESQ